MNNNKNTQSHKGSRYKVTPARKLAYKVLHEVRNNSVFLEQAWKICSKHVSLPTSELGFARLLATTVVSHRGSLNILINKILRNPNDIQNDVRDALSISFAELFYLDKPNHVVVNEGVELVRSVSPKAVGLANFVLRRATEAKPDFPFGDPKTEPKAASLLFGFPQWLVEKLINEFGFEEACRFMANSNAPAPLFFIINQANANGPQTLKGLVNQGVKLAPISRIQQSKQGLSCFVFSQRNEIGHTYVEDLLKKGTLVISDGAAQLASSLAVPHTYPHSFLEIGAGRGTKTILLQNIALSRFGKQMHIDTLDVDQGRTKERHNRLKQAGILQSESFSQDATNLSNFASGSYDSIFIDAPCSGLGTLRRHADIRWRVSEKHINDFALTGLKILKEASRLVKSGGTITYATCTVFSEENEQVIKDFLASKEGIDFSCTHIELISDLFSDNLRNPAFDSHFICVLTKNDA